MGKNAKLKEKQKWAEEQIHLENARKLRGIYFIDPEDKEIKETIKNARKKLETSVAPAMPCKIMKNCGSGGSDKNKTKLACILEANESTRMRMGNSEPSNHEDHIAGKGENSLQHYNLVHKFIPMPQAMKIPAAKAAVDKEWEKLEKICSSPSSWMDGVFRAVRWVMRGFDAADSERTVRPESPTSPPVNITPYSCQQTNGKGGKGKENTTYSRKGR